VSADALFYSELLLALGAVVGWGIWELHKLKKDK
jgi:hypothetical protein